MRLELGGIVVTVTVACLV